MALFCAVRAIQQLFPAWSRTSTDFPRSKGADLRVVFGLWVSGQMILRRIKGCRDIGGKEKAA